MIPSPVSQPGRGLSETECLPLMGGPKSRPVHRSRSGQLLKGDDPCSPKLFLHSSHQTWAPTATLFLLVSSFELRDPLRPRYSIDDSCCVIPHHAVERPTPSSPRRLCLVWPRHSTSTQAKGAGHRENPLIKRVGGSGHKGSGTESGPYCRIWTNDGGRNRDLRRHLQGDGELAAACGG